MLAIVVTLFVLGLAVIILAMRDRTFLLRKQISDQEADRIKLLGQWASDQAEMRRQIQRRDDVLAEMGEDIARLDEDLRGAFVTTNTRERVTRLGKLLAQSGVVTRYVSKGKVLAIRPRIKPLA